MISKAIVLISWAYLWGHIVAWACRGFAVISQ